MNFEKVINERHTVRHYDGQPIKPEHVGLLNQSIAQINKVSNLSFILFVNEPKAFDGGKANMSNFTGCVNYLALIGPKNVQSKILAGYYGEQLVLEAQNLGINSCWVALTFNPQMDLYNVASDQELYGVIALGYGTTQGKPHISKSINQVVANNNNLPSWFIKGVEFALLAPTGKNQQGFMFELLDDNNVRLTNKSFCDELDYGIVKYHFEIGAGKENFNWKK